MELAAGAVAGIDQPFFLQKVKIPVVNVTALTLGRSFPVVTTDNAATPRAKSFTLGVTINF